MKLTTLIKNNKARAFVVIYAVIILIGIIIAIIVLAQGQPSYNPEFAIETDPASNVEVVNTNFAPEIVDGPMYLGTEDLYRHYDANFVRLIQATIEKYAEQQFITLERVSMVANSLSEQSSGSATSQNLTTITTFDVVLNEDQQKIRVEVSIPFSSDIVCKLMNENDQEVYSEILDI